MRKLLASLPIVVTAVVLASQPAGAKSDPDEHRRRDRSRARSSRRHPMRFAGLDE
jgi:hypothetical protein